MSRRIVFFTAALTVALVLTPGARAQREILDCEAERTQALLPTDPALCADLAEVVRQPSRLPLDEYEEKLGEFLRNFCHRDQKAGWKGDKFVRDTGPFTARLQDRKWSGEYHGTHQPVVIWYSEEMLEWMKRFRPPNEDDAPAEADPVPDGAIIVKEMFPAPGASCRKVDKLKLFPTSGAAVMIRDQAGSQDGWFWGWFGWPGEGWRVDWPAPPTNSLPNMGFGQYCMNCHASARDFTFASLKNVEGEPGEPLVFLSQHFYDAEAPATHHRLVTLPEDDADRLGEPSYAYSGDFQTTFPATLSPQAPPTWDSVAKMPSETYDNVWVSAGGPTAANELLTSDQCLGCHDAGSTGLQFDMTAPNPHGDNLLNFSPYGTWRTSPMGLGGRDPIFYAQLASETDTFHNTGQMPEIIQNTCLGCHGILGQRQYAIDETDTECDDLFFLRKYANVAPYPTNEKENPLVHLASYGALARDGISCTACHHMLVGEGGGEALDEPENRCVKERQEFLNPKNEGFARTFTGSFLVGPPGELFGPFEDPKTRPMEDALGILPVHDESVRNSALCGTCHTVHLPVFDEGKLLGYTYEQTTYPEWAMSAYRTGVAPDGGGELPHGSGKLAESCQSCHMPSKDDEGRPLRTKIASIQEYSNFPQAEYNYGPGEIDLTVRENFARHTLVGLNVFFVKMAQQFPDVLGIRTQDPMMVTSGLDPLLLTEQAMLDQASNGTATVTVDEVGVDGGKLHARVTVRSDVGHKLPSGVGFRRAFLEFQVTDGAGGVLWASGRTNGAGVLVDENGDPIAGELWWKDDCSARATSAWPPPHQPHYQVVRRQNEAQIYQELVLSPADVADPKCGKDATPGGELTTSFLSICAHLKDNRLLPQGFLDEKARVEIAEALGAGADLAKDTGPFAVDGDKDYETGGKDSLRYEIPLAEIGGRPVAVQATLYYQATPPFYLQDRFCTSTSDDTERLYFLAGHLNLEGTEAQSWKLKVVSAQADVP